MDSSRIVSNIWDTSVTTGARKLPLRWNWTHSLFFLCSSSEKNIAYPIVCFEWYEYDFKSVVSWPKDGAPLKNCDEQNKCIFLRHLWENLMEEFTELLWFFLINWYKLFAWKMISTSKQDLHDFPDLSPPSAAQLLINAKDYANHRNHHCITSSWKEGIKIESSSKIVMLSLHLSSLNISWVLCA